MVVITSRANPRLKLARSLLQRRGRERTGRWLAEGVRVLEEAISYGRTPETLFVTEEAVADERVGRLVERVTQQGGEVCHVPFRLLAEVSDAKTPQGVVGIVPAPPEATPDVLFHPERERWLLVLDRVQEPGNLGTMLRTAHAAGMSGAIRIHGTVDPGHPKAIRASAGAVFGLPVLTLAAGDTVELLRVHGVPLIALDVDGTVSVYDVDWTGPSALLVGHEAHGPSQELLDAAAKVVSIPMPGGGESLNAATAVAVCAYEAVRQRGVVRRTQEAARRG